tara:strand:+ start:134 stop:958 length:825 start_codon:yes stop_codon:yes gene_type:complete
MKTKKFLNNPLLTFIFFIYLVWIFKSYTGNIHSMYIDMYQFTKSIYPYTNDFFLNRSIQHDASLIYKFFKFFPITPDNDYFGLLIHFLVSTASGILLYSILYNFTEISDRKFLIIFLFSILLIGRHFNPETGNTVTWVSSNSMTPTYFAHFLNFIFLYLLLNRKLILIALVSSLMVFVGIKASWYVLTCGIVFSLFHYKNFKSNIWILAPIISLIYISQYSVYNLSFDEKIFVFEDIVKSDGPESSFFELQFIYVFKIILSFLIFYFIWKKNKR